MTKNGVMNFLDIKFPRNFEYSTDTDDLPLEFYLTIFPRSKFVYLKLGYFSSSAIKVLAYGFAQFIYRGGKIKIVSNHFLYNSDKLLLEIENLSEDKKHKRLLNNLCELKEALSSENFALETVHLTNKQVGYLVEFLKTLTDPCTQDRECLGQWIPDGTERNDPNGDQLNAVDQQGNLL